MDLFTLTLDTQAKAYLERVLDEDLADTRVELRRTRDPALRDQLKEREKLIRGLLQAFQGAKPSDGVGSGPRVDVQPIQA